MLYDLTGELNQYITTGDSIRRAKTRERQWSVRLAKSVLEAAYVDLVDDRESVRAEALTFFVGGEFRIYADVAHVDHDTVLNGCANVLADGLPIVDGRQERSAGTCAHSVDVR